ncbi:hypothetical protein STSP2_02658 [Anaerohalosphaera lusitana]|uniref:Uncharacterized protein n=1 Tax=Anaerohalosphaera lusitana TaxID=1936003 RepID=A0A1U9NP21_9BACT|nr:hypothetical protein [Anaerohalosphaera lusitana]AQT69468.1 hypothetical protein STSP2_02658 [Anaerohalosphaera lusitana]
MQLHVLPRRKSKSRQNHNLETIRILEEKQRALEESWLYDLEPLARLLSELHESNFELTTPPDEAINAALAAWQLGGEACMRKLRDMTIERSKPDQAQTLSQCLDFWWDGIGSWRLEPALSR